MRLDLESQFLLRILLLHFYEYQHNFIGPANCLCCLWKGWNIFTHSLCKTLLLIRALVGKNCCSLGQGPRRFKASTSCWAILGCCCPPLTYPMLQPQAGCAKELGFIPFFPLPSWMLGSGRKVAVCLCQHRAPYTKGIFCYVPVARLESLYTVQAMYPRDKITKVSLRCCCDPLLPVLTHHPSLWGSPIYFGQESKPGTCGPRYLLFCSVWNTLTRPSTMLLHIDTQKSTPLRCVKIALPYIALL